MFLFGTFLSKSDSAFEFTVGGQNDGKTVIEE
jgi:hypothetical protein